MNLDLLIKLVKLANNNPNENEANLAARRVCQMIEKANYKFINNQPTNSVNYSSEWVHPPNPPYSPMDDLIRDMYENRQRNNWGSSTADKGPKRKRQCSECGKEVETRNEDLYFRCGSCQWKKYAGGAW